MAENNPWVKGEAMEAALIFRGAIISAYGLIKIRLAEVSIRCSKMPAYEKIRGDFPYPMHKRLAYLRAAFSQGPLAQFQGLAEAFLKRFEASTELRHMMAHAYMEASGDLVGWGATFHDYQPSKGGGITYRRATCVSNSWNMRQPSPRGSAASRANSIGGCTAWASCLRSLARNAPGQRDKEPCRRKLAQVLIPK